MGSLRKNGRLGDPALPSLSSRPVFTVGVSKTSTRNNLFGQLSRCPALVSARYTVIIRFSMDSLHHRFASSFDLQMLQSELSSELRNRLSDLVQTSCTRPDWILLGFEHDTLTAILILAAPTDFEFPVEIIPLRVSLSHRDASAILFESVIQKAKKLGASELFCYEPEDAADATFLSSLGFRQWRNVMRFDSAAAPQAKPASPLLPMGSNFERHTIVALIAQASEHSDDMQTQYYRERLGEIGDAEMMLQIIESTRHDKSWWRVALNAEGQPIGIVIPIIGFGEPTIGFIGVSPGVRGRGVATRLLLEARSVVAHHGYSSLSAETDAGNRAMHRALAKSGFVRQWQKQEWRFSFL
jgi:RimJ/RimL family protein N-acetyltransferase